MHCYAWVFFLYVGMFVCACKVSVSLDLCARVHVLVGVSLCAWLSKCFNVSLYTCTPDYGFIRVCMPMCVRMCPHGASFNLYVGVSVSTWLCLPVRGCVLNAWLHVSV